MKRIRAAVLGILLPLSSCAAGAGAVTQSEARQECANEAFVFVQVYLDLKARGIPPQELAATVPGNPAFVARARRFIEAEARGDIEGAKAALDDLFENCVQDLMYPKSEA